MSTMYSDGTYLANTVTWHAEDSSWKAAQIASLLRDNRINPTTVAEVGCGAGGILSELLSAFPAATFTGYEVSPQAFELCRMNERQGLSFKLSDISSESTCFDCLLCIDVFEHVEDCFGLVRSIKPKAQYKVFHIPLDISALSVARRLMLDGHKSVGHIHYYTRLSALAFLRDCGYEILDERYTKLFDYHAAKSWKARVMQSLQRAAHRISPHRATEILGGCSLLVLAR
jgi:hypothetical protein